MFAATSRVVAWSLGMVVSFVLCTSASNAIEPPASQLGGLAPRFQADDLAGCPWKSENHVRMQIVVVFLYRGDFCQGCVRQVHGYCDNRHYSLARMSP